MPDYICLTQNERVSGNFSLVPIRSEDQYDIMKWRNEQIHHLRQNKPLTQEDQQAYFANVVDKLFGMEQPGQLLFSFLENGVCIGYGGLVHLNWVDKHAEISFVLNTELQSERFHEIWSAYLGLIQQVGFQDLQFHKLFTYAFDIRPHLYTTLEASGFEQDARLKEHCLFQGKMIDVLIHSKWNQEVRLRKATVLDAELTFQWAIDPVIRQYSFVTKAISWDEHHSWFKQKIEDSNCDYFIVKSGAGAVGSVRLDYKNDGSEGVISYLVDRLQHGKGLGKKLLTLLEENVSTSRKELKVIVGFVQESNKASIAIFNGLGYQSSITDGVYRFEKRVNK